MTTNLWNVFAMNVSAAEVMLHILSMLCVGFIEEVIFPRVSFQGNLQKQCRAGQGI